MEQDKTIEVKHDLAWRVGVLMKVARPRVSFEGKFRVRKKWSKSVGLGLSYWKS